MPYSYILTSTVSSSKIILLRPSVVILSSYHQAPAITDFLLFIFAYIR